MIFKDRTKTPEQRQADLAAFFEARRPVGEALHAHTAAKKRALELFLEDGELGVETAARVAAYAARTRAARERMCEALRKHREEEL